MLIIRNSQFNALQDGKDDALAVDLAASFAGRYPERGLVDKALIAAAREGIARARSYGLDRYADISSYVDFHLLIGPRFDTHPPINAILADPDIPVEIRIGTLIEQVPPAEWRAAAMIENEPTEIEEHPGRARA
ncbi:MAG: hypothetical protein JWQ98_2706 [Chlorobi bacterium]|nr:hypothetical protein [Chlorobiota bacterium]